jgi:hypothetical protein
MHAVEAEVVVPAVTSADVALPALFGQDCSCTELGQQQQHGTNTLLR